MKRAQIEIAARLFKEWLQLGDMEVWAAKWDFERGVLELYVTHDALPDVPDGVQSLTVQPTYKIAECGHICDLGVHRQVIRDSDLHYGNALLHIPLSTSGETP